MKKKTPNDTVIISPVRGKNEPAVGPDALMVFIPDEINYLVQVAKAHEISLSDMSMYHLYQTDDRSGPPLTISGPFLGAPHAVIALEKLIVLGAERIWVLGWCGSLQPDLRIGRLVIPTGAVSEEGTSSHYPIYGKSLESDAKLNRMLEAELKQRGLSFSEGPVWTTDAPYRETLDKVKAYQAQGILGVEMEISALMTVSLYRSVAMAGLLVVSDELFDLRWRPGFSNPSLKKASRAAGEVLLSLTASLTQNNTPEPE